MTEPVNEPVIRVLVADDQALVRKGILALLSTESKIVVVGEVDNGREAVAKASELKPDVILMDLKMPEMDGIEASRQIMEKWPQARILVLTSYATDDLVFPAIKAGAFGYLLKDSEPEELVQAILQIHRGEPSLHPKIARKVLQEISGGPNLTKQKQIPDLHAGKPAVDPLTNREVEVLQLLARGMSNQDIAELLVISSGTVRTHVSNILSKLHLASRTQATLYALKEGLTSLDEANIQPDES
jgi:NarL family two-component system response regulator LiaR